MIGSKGNLEKDVPRFVVCHIHANIENSMRKSLDKSDFCGY